jgi:integrase
MPRPAQRCVIALYETSARLNEILNLKKDRIDRKAGLIRFRAEDVKEKAPRVTPISAELAAVLDELESEPINIDGYVFTRRGKRIKNIYSAFDNAKEKTGIKNLRLHDFRHTAITRWSTMGIPRDIVMAASGYHSVEMHDAYVNIKDSHIKDAFSVVTGLQHGRKLEAAANVSH